MTLRHSNRRSLAATPVAPVGPVSYGLTVGYSGGGARAAAGMVAAGALASLLAMALLAGEARAEKVPSTTDAKARLSPAGGEAKAAAPTKESKARGSSPRGVVKSAAAVAAAAPKAMAAPVMNRERLSRMEAGKNGRFVVPLDGVDLVGPSGARAELTIDGRLQRMADRVLKQHGTPYGAAVLMNVSDGRVLAMAGRAPEEKKSAAELCLTPWAPAASIFKLVTAAALLATGVKPTEKVCYHDGLRNLDASNLSDSPKLDRDCNSLAFGLAKSQNAIVARFTVDHLKAGALSAMARAFSFGEKLPGDVAAAPSEAQIPSDPLAFARVAAGFWRTTLSPLHGAFIAATIARGGTTPPVRLVSRVVDENGVTAEVLAATHEKRVLDEKLAHTLGKMMVGTTGFGTAYRSFHDKQGRSTLRGVQVAGKTGTLTRRDGDYLLYSWFVGFAPASKPKVAFAVLLGNGPERYVRAHRVARDLLQGYFHGGSSKATLVAAR